MVHLHFSENQLTTLPKGIGKLRKIRIADFSDNNISSLSEEFGNAPFISELTLNNNPLTSLPKWLENMQGALQISRTKIDLKKLFKKIYEKAQRKRVK